MAIRCFMLTKTEKVGNPFEGVTAHVYQTDDGQEFFLANAPVGAMWYAPWYDDLYKAQHEHVLVVRCPGNYDWVIDSQASNCTIPEDKTQERHHCWVAHGTPPNLTVDKSGPTCAAGAGSIQAYNYDHDRKEYIPGWHGFLRNGELVD